MTTTSTRLTRSRCACAFAEHTARDASRGMRRVASRGMRRAWIYVERRAMRTRSWITRPFMVLVQPRKASRSRLSVEEICRTRAAALLTLWLLLLLPLLRVNEGL